MGFNDRQTSSSKDHRTKKFLTGCLSLFVILLLLGGLVFAIFSFVDQSQWGKEHLQEKSIEEQQKKKKQRKRKKEKSKRKKNVSVRQV
ncbi:DUF4887 domain-containing protein [Staphylococcus chromogenes]|nr:DUF4887 domain-containing protein [Staphylococcus chromogenes]